MDPPAVANARLALRPGSFESGVHVNQMMIAIIFTACKATPRTKTGHSTVLRRGQSLGVALELSSSDKLGRGRDGRKPGRQARGGA
jgi:hypothetical protein